MTPTPESDRLAAAVRAYLAAVERTCEYPPENSEERRQAWHAMHAALATYDAAKESTRERT